MREKETTKRVVRTIKSKDLTEQQMYELWGDLRPLYVVGPEWSSFEPYTQYDDGIRMHLRSREELGLIPRSSVEQLQEHNRHWKQEKKKEQKHQVKQEKRDRPKKVNGPVLVKGQWTPEDEAKRLQGIAWRKEYYAMNRERLLANARAKKQQRNGMEAV